MTACQDIQHDGSKQPYHAFRVHPYGEALIWIARFSVRMAVLQLIGKAMSLRLLHPSGCRVCPASGKPHTPARSTEVSWINCVS